jgi:hypothetical protein
LFFKTHTGAAQIGSTDFDAVWQYPKADKINADAGGGDLGFDGMQF